METNTSQVMSDPGNAGWNMKPETLGYDVKIKLARLYILACFLLGALLTTEMKWIVGSEHM